MKITEIHLIRFKRFGRVDIVIPDDAEFICITGPNGSGKSTSLNSVEFALYGVSGGLSADHIVSSFAEPGERCEVGLEFTHSGHKFNILRTFKKGKSIQHDAVIKCDGEVRATGVSAVEAEVIRTIGLTAKDFNMVVYSKQDDLRAITDITPGKREEWFRKGFDLDFIKTASEKILKERIKATEQAIATLQGELAALSRQDPAELGQTKKDLADLSEAIFTLKAQEQEQQAARAAFATQKQEYDLKTVQQSKLVDQHNGLLFDIDTIRKRIETLGVQLGSLTVDTEELARLEKAADEIPQARLDVEGYRTKKAEAERINTEEKAALREEANIRERRDRVQANLADLETSEKEREDLYAKVRVALCLLEDEDVDNGVAEYQKRTTEKIAYLNAEARTNRGVQDKIRKSLESIRDIGPEGTCPTCLQKLGEHFGTVEADYLAQLNEAVDEEHDIDAKLDTALHESQKIPDLKPILDRIKQISTALGYRENLQNEREDLNKGILNVTQRIGDLIEEYWKVRYNEEDHLACKDNLVKLEAAQTQYTELTKRSAEPAGIRAQVAELNSQITTKNATRAEVKAVIDANPIILTEGPRLTHEIENLDISLKNITQDLATSIEREKTLTQKVTDLEIAAASIGTVEQQLATLNEELEVLALTRSAISDYVLYIMQVMRSAIETESSAILSGITEGKYSQVIVDEGFNILIREGDKDYALDRYSGGEQDVIALSLRMALSNIIPKLHGVHETFPFLIDEGLSSLDPERKENTVRAMRQQAKRCGQVFNNTHDQEVVGDYNLRVQANGPVSTVQAGA